VRLWRNLRARAGAVLAAMAAAPAHASMFSGEALDTAADVLAIVVLILVPLVGIAVFWVVHVLPEKIAHKRHHPQRDAIQTLCLLSLVFGGLLWPIAWLWAYTRPVTYKMAYGTDRHEDYYEEMAERHRTGQLAATDIAHLREDLAAMQSRGALPPKLRALKTALDEAARDAQPAAGGPA
jgi:CBS domain containing-hemolysin-like protein